MHVLLSSLSSAPWRSLLLCFVLGALSLVAQYAGQMWVADGGVAILGNIVADWGWVSLEQEMVYETLDYCFYDVGTSNFVRGRKVYDRGSLCFFTRNTWQ